MRKFFIAVCALALLVPAIAFAASDADVHTAIEQSMASGKKAGKIEKIVDVYGGQGVIAGDDALWWVKDGTVFTVNGIATELSPNAAKAPPSVTAQKIQAAALGEAFPLPETLGLTSEELVVRVTALLEKLNAAKPTCSPLKKQTYYEYSVSAGKSTAAQFVFKECGGMVTAVDLNGYAVSKSKDTKTPATLVLALALIYAVSPDKDVAGQFVKIMTESKRGGAKTLGNISMTFKRQKDMLDISISPVAEQPKGSPKAEGAEPYFQVTTKQFVDKYNKAAKAAKVDQKASLATANEKSTQVKVGKHNGALLTTNAAGKITSVIYIGTGDGTPESGANILLGLGFAIAGVKPNWSPKQRLDVLKKLGFGTSDSLPEKSSVTMEGVLFEFRFSQETGVWLIMTPK